MSYSLIWSCTTTTTTMHSAADDLLTLCHGLRQGDEKCFEAIFHRLYQPLCRFAYSYLRQTERAEELVQDSFTKLWEIRAELKEDTRLKPYLYKLVQNRCLNEIKHRQVSRAYLDYSARSQAHYHEPTEVDYQELQTRLDQALSELGPTTLEIFKRSRYQGLKYKEIAEELQISVKTVEKHMTRALMELREKLRDYLPAWLLLFLTPFF